MKILAFLITSLLVTMQRVESTKEVLDMQEDLILKPLSTLPIRNCNSSMRSINNLHCCTRECYIQPYDITKLPILDEYAIECHENLESLKSCDLFTMDLDLLRIRRILEFETRREREWNDKLNALKNRLSPIELKKRIFQWSGRLVASWILHKIFSKGFEVAQPIISSMLSAPIG